MKLTGSCGFNKVSIAVFLYRIISHMPQPHSSSCILELTALSIWLQEHMHAFCFHPFLYYADSTSEHGSLQIAVPVESEFHQISMCVLSLKDEPDFGENRCRLSSPKYIHIPPTACIVVTVLLSRIQASHHLSRVLLTMEG